jgi:hypothetical protein
MWPVTIIFVTVPFVNYGFSATFIYHETEVYVNAVFIYWEDKTVKLPDVIRAFRCNFTDLVYVDRFVSVSSEKFNIPNL